jgi:hypothetical protein
MSVNPIALGELGHEPIAVLKTLDVVLAKADDRVFELHWQRNI